MKKYWSAITVGWLVLKQQEPTSTVCFHAGVRMRIEVSRSEFEEMTADFVERTETTSSLVIRQQAFDLAAHNQTVNLSDRGSVVKRLDVLYAKVGAAAQRLQVPSSLLASQRMARTAAAELCQAIEALEQAQEQTEASLHDAAAFGQQAELARAKSALDQTRVRADLTCVVFGRECVEREFFAAGLETLLQEIRQLRQHLDRLH